MTLELLYLAGCPNHGATVDMVHSVLQAEGVSAAVRQILIASREEATALQFPGSPTLRVNGADVERFTGELAAMGLACRTYFVQGKAQGLPPRSLVVKAIRAARKEEENR